MCVLGSCERSYVNACVYDGMRGRLIQIIYSINCTVDSYKKFDYVAEVGQYSTKIIDKVSFLNTHSPEHPPPPQPHNLIYYCPFLRLYVGYM